MPARPRLKAAHQRHTRPAGMRVPAASKRLAEAVQFPRNTPAWLTEAARAVWRWCASLGAAWATGRRLQPAPQSLEAQGGRLEGRRPSYVVQLLQLLHVHGALVPSGAYSSVNMCENAAGLLPRAAGVVQPAKSRGLTWHSKAGTAGLPAPLHHRLDFNVVLTSRSPYQNIHLPPAPCSPSDPPPTSPALLDSAAMTVPGDSSEDDVPLVARKPQAAVKPEEQPASAPEAAEAKPRVPPAAAPADQDDSSDDEQPLALRRQAVKQGEQPSGCLQAH